MLEEEQWAFILLVVYHFTVWKHSLKYLISGEGFQYNVYHLQYLVVQVELTVIMVIFLVIEVELSEVPVWLVCVILFDIISANSTSNWKQISVTASSTARHWNSVPKTVCWNSDNLVNVCAWWSDRKLIYIKVQINMDKISTFKLWSQSLKFIGLLKYLKYVSKLSPDLYTS